MIFLAVIETIRILIQFKEKAFLKNISELIFILICLAIVYRVYKIIQQNELNKPVPASILNIDFFGLEMV